MYICIYIYPFEINSRLHSTKSKAMIASSEFSISKNKTKYKTQKKVPSIGSRVYMKNGFPNRPRTYQSKNLPKLAIFRNESMIRLQNAFSNATNKPSFNVRNIIQKHKKKEVVKKKTYNLSEVFSIHRNITSYKNDNNAINNFTNDPTQLLQKPLQQHQKSFIELQEKWKDHNELSKPKNLSITCPEIGNFTFTNQPPFDVLGIPQCGNKVQPEFR